MALGEPENKDYPAYARMGEPIVFRNIVRSIVVIFLVILATMLPGCSSPLAVYTKYSYEFLGSFDTVVQFIGYAKNQSEFEDMAKSGETRFMELHRLYDIYNDYDGINNIKTINDNAGVEPVRVCQEIIDLLEFSKAWHDKTGGTVNIAMGPVLSIWHEYREHGLNDPDDASLPPMERLLEAQKFCDIQKVIVDPDARTVFLPDKNMRIDVGAVAKGFAVEIVARELQEQGYSSFLISAGGNVKVVGEPLDNTRSKWGIGILDPDGDMSSREDSTLDTVYINRGSVVTSGDYQRYYKVDGIMYHHLIDPETLMPAAHYRSVTVYVGDSGEADFLSTTLFLLPYEKSRKLADELESVEALWVFPDGSFKATEGMKPMLKVLGGASNK
mgnify:CR=1 FL=1|jgi:thiamine biosynthesis lipoprotein